MIKWEYLDEIISLKQIEWSINFPTKFIIIDDLIEDQFCSTLADFSEIEFKYATGLRKQHKHVRGKSGTSDRSRMNEAQVAFFEIINSQRFLTVVEKITGISPLYSDNSLDGGGLHQTRRHGYLNVHTDFNLNRDTGLRRRLNLLLYLNQGWAAEWGGAIEFWDEQLDSPIFTTMPLMNRIMLFETGDSSYHGHPEPLTCPPDIIRKSMAVYYYSDWPNGPEPRRGTNYQLTRIQWARLMLRIAKLMMKRKRSEEEVVDSLQLEYMKQDIRRAYRTLIDLRSAPKVREDFWESPDGILSLEDPNKDSTHVS